MRFVGLYTYCKMMHGAYSVKLTTGLFPQTCLRIVKLLTLTESKPYLAQSSISSVIWPLLPAHYRCKGSLLYLIRLSDEGSASRTDLYLTTHNVHKTERERKRDIPASAGVRTHNSSKRAAPDSHLRPHGHWDRVA